MQPEPFFISVALYDAREGQKISEDFCFDPNSDEIRSMIPKDLLGVNDMMNSVGAGGNRTEPTLKGLDPDWLAFPKMVRHWMEFFSCIFL